METNRTAILRAPLRRPADSLHAMLQSFVDNPSGESRLERINQLQKFDHADERVAYRCICASPDEIFGRTGACYS